jgi:hypothetical protein
MYWLGWVLTVLAMLALLLSGIMKLVKPTGFDENIAKLGWKPDDAFVLAILEFACVVLYVFPRTSILGAILATGYFGGAVATHLRLHEYGEMAPPIVLGVLAWGGIYLRCGRVRALIPWRS